MDPGLGKPSFTNFTQGISELQDAETKGKGRGFEDRGRNTDTASRFSDV